MDRQLPRRRRVGHGPVRGRDGLVRLVRAPPVISACPNPTFPWMPCYTCHSCMTGRKGRPECGTVIRALFASAVHLYRGVLPWTADFPFFFLGWDAGIAAGLTSDDLLFSALLPLLLNHLQSYGVFGLSVLCDTSTPCSISPYESTLHPSIRSSIVLWKIAYFEGDWAECKACQEYVEFFQLG